MNLVSLGTNPAEMRIEGKLSNTLGLEKRSDMESVVR